MKSIRSIFVALLLFVGISAFSSNFMITATMKNGDVISGKTTLTKLNVKTAYGELNIPAENITNIELGIITDKSKETAVQLELKKLQMASSKEAETIYKNLLNMGPSILSIVKSYTENNNYQISDNYDHSIEKLLDNLYDKADLEYGASINDVVEFDLDNKVEGTISLNEIQLLSNYGTLNLKRENISSIELSVLDDNVSLGDNVFKLKASKHITGNEDEDGWLNTGIKVKAGDKITISASGKIVLKSLSGGIYGPDGFIGGKEDSAYDAEADIPYGALVYKIGEDGTEQKVGSKSIIEIEESGTLYLSIYETVYNDENTGSYTVKVVTK